MATTLVTISRKGNTIKVDLNPAEPEPGDKLQWTCAEPFAVLFKRMRSPLKSGHTTLAGDAGDTTKDLEVRFLSGPEKHVRDTGSNQGRRQNGDIFEYTIAVMNTDTDEVITKDPDIIIDDGSGGPS